MARFCMVLLNDYMSDSRVRREAEALVERGDTVDCICLSEKKFNSLGGVRLLYPSAHKYRGNNRPRLLMRYVQFFCYAFLKISFEHLRNPYDVVQVHTMPDFLIYTAVIPKLLGARLVLDIHDLMPELYVAKYGPTRSKWMVSLITWIERRSVAFADRAIAVHKPHLDVLVKHGNPPEKFSMLLNVPDHRIFNRRVPAPSKTSSGGPFTLLYHGTMPKRAGLDIALRAVARARNDIPGIRFQIVGRGEAVNELLELSKELDVTDCLSWRPSVPVEDLPEIILGATVGVVPYRSDAFTQYVLPTKLMEYVAMGLPAIVSRLPSVEAYFDSRMVAYFEPGDEVGLAEQIVRLYRAPELAGQYVEHAARFTETYNWPQQRQIYYRLMDELMAGRRVPVNAKTRKDKAWHKTML
jgi:glycosyltransferase involved in cell wall biosynthesis